MLRFNVKLVPATKLRIKLVPATISAFRRNMARTVAAIYKEHVFCYKYIDPDFWQKFKLAYRHFRQAQICLVN